METRHSLPWRILVQHAELRQLKVMLLHVASCKSACVVTQLCNETWQAMGHSKRALWSIPLKSGPCKATQPCHLHGSIVLVFKPEPTCIPLRRPHNCMWDIHMLV